MKIFIFEPYKWSYCGGAIVIIAKDYESATKLINKKLKEEHDNEGWKSQFKPHKFFKEDIGEDGFEQWILSQELELKDNIQKPKMLITNWNWA